MKILSVKAYIVVCQTNHISLLLSMYIMFYYEGAYLGFLVLRQTVCLQFTTNLCHFPSRRHVGEETFSFTSQDLSPFKYATRQP